MEELDPLDLARHKWASPLPLNSTRPVCLALQGTRSQWPPVACPFQPPAAFEKSQTYSSRPYTPSKWQHGGITVLFKFFFLFSQSLPFQSPEQSPLTCWAVSSNVICTSLCKHCCPLFHALTTYSLTFYHCQRVYLTHTPPPSPSVSFSQHHYITVSATVVTLGNTLHPPSSPSLSSDDAPPPRFPRSGRSPCSLPSSLLLSLLPVSMFPSYVLLFTSSPSLAFPL